MNEFAMSHLSSEAHKQIRKSWRFVIKHVPPALVCCRAHIQEDSYFIMTKLRLNVKATVISNVKKLMSVN